IGIIALILSAHFSGMFGFSPVWGAFLDRVGRREGLLLGAALVAIGGLLAGVPQGAVSALGLFLVGLGWSGAYLGATAVISDQTSIRSGNNLATVTNRFTSTSTAGSVFRLSTESRKGSPAIARVVSVSTTPNPVRPPRWSFATAPLPSAANVNRRLAAVLAK